MVCISEESLNCSLVMLIRLTQNHRNNRNMYFGGKSLGTPGLSSTPQIPVGAKVKWRHASKEACLPKPKHRVSLLREAHIDLCLHLIFFPCSSSVLLEIGTCPKMSPPVMTRIAPLKTQEWREINCVWSSVKKLCTRTGRKAWRNLRKKDSRHSWKYKRKFKSNDVGDTQGAEN